MIEIENTVVYGFCEAVRGARNSWNSHEKSDTHDPHDEDHTEGWKIGDNDLKLLLKLVKAGDCHAKCMRMVTVWFDLTAPRYFWTQFDTYKYLVRCSESTMHTITKREIAKEDFGLDELDKGTVIFSDIFTAVIFALNKMRAKFLEITDNNAAKKAWWRRIIKLLPQSYMQKSTICTNYQTLRNMYLQRQGHKLSEWQEFRKWVETLPYSELITGAGYDEDE